MQPLKASDSRATVFRSKSSIPSGDVVSSAVTSAAITPVLKTRISPLMVPTAFLLLPL
jgi:hypothetical protein